MPPLELEDWLFNEIVRRAQVRGYKSAEAYIEHVVRLDLKEPDDLQYRFTPEVIADLNRIMSEVKAGAKTYTPEEVKAHLERKRHERRTSHSG
jgi:hypothetical protein